MFSIILSPVPLLLSFHLGSLHLFVFHYHLFVLSPIIPSPCFPSFCLPSFCGPLCNSHHHLFILSPIIPSSWLSSGILSPCILFPNIPLSCLRSSLRLASLIIVFFTILCPVIPSPVIPASPTAKNSWVQSLEAEQPVLVQRLRPQLLAMHPGPHHFVSHHPFILSPFVLFRAFSRHPCIPNYRELLGWISGSRGPVLPSSLHLVSLYVVGLHLFSHHHLSILPPITFILFPRIPSCCLRVPTHLFLIIILHSHYSQQPCSWVSISGPGPGATFHGRENPEHLAVEPLEPMEPVALEPLHFLNPRNFWNLWNQLNAWGSHRFQAFLGFKHAMVPQVPHRFHTGSRQVPWVQLGHWFHKFQTGSLGSTTLWFHSFQTGFLGSKNARFHRFQTGSLGSTTHWFHRVPDRFLGFKHAMVPQVPHRFLGFNTPLVPQLPDRFLGFNHAMGSTDSMQVPWVQPRHWFHRIPDRFFGLKHAMVPQVSRQFPWVQPRHWFHRFPTGSLGSTVEPWELWRVWISVTTQTTFSPFLEWAGIRFWQECLSRMETTPLVPQVPDRFLGFNRGTVGIVEGVNHQTVVLFNVPLSINQQREPWSLGNLVSHSSCLPIILEPCFLSFCLPSLCYYPFILALFIFLSSTIISSYCPPLSLHLVSLRFVSHPFVARYVVPIIIFSSCLPSSLHLDCPRASCLLVSCSPTSLCLVFDHPFVLPLSSLYFSPFCVPSYLLPSSLHPQQQKTLGFNLWKQSSRY